LDGEENPIVQELLNTIQSAAGETLAVDRRPQLNDRLLHRIMSLTRAAILPWKLT
jgi:hypothetical protein